MDFFLLNAVCLAVYVDYCTRVLVFKKMPRALVIASVLDDECCECSLVCMFKLGQWYLCLGYIKIVGSMKNDINGRLF